MMAALVYPLSWLRLIHWSRKESFGNACKMVVYADFWFEQRSRDEDIYQIRDLGCIHGKTRGEGTW